MRREPQRTGRSWQTLLGLGTIAIALTVVGIALPLWVLTDGDLTEAAGWANILALPTSLVGLVLTLVGQRHERSLNSPTPPARRRPWMAPPLERMIERPDVGSDLLQTLIRPEPAEVALTTELLGAGGFGKTRLATWVCHRPEIAHRYPGGLLWTTIGQDARDADLAVRINDMIFALTGERSSIAQSEAAGAELGRVLDDHEPILMIIDDVWDVAQLRPFRIGGRRTTRLITTRVPDVLPMGGVRIPVDAMLPHQARELVIHGVPDVPDDVAQRLAVLAGRWPVLLNLVNGVLKRRVERGQVAVDAAREVIDELVRKGPTALDPTRPSDRSQAVNATVEASLHMLSSQDQRRYVDLGMFAEDVEIPVSVLTMLWDIGRVPQLCEDLASLGLVADYRLDEPGPRLVLHDVMWAFLQGRRSAAEWRLTHGRLVDAVTRRLFPSTGIKPWWLLPDDMPYLWRYLPFHLRRAGRLDELTGLITDLRWVEEKTRRFGSVAAVLTDLELSEANTARTLARHLDRAAPLLGPIDPSPALGATLASRLHGVVELEGLLESYRNVLARPRLEPAWPLPDRMEDRTTQIGHSGGVTGCTFSPDQTLLATVSDDATVRLWQVAEGRQLTVLLGHVGGIWDCAFSPDGTMLATASTDRTVRIWSVATGQATAVLYGHTDWVRSCAFSPDGTMVASSSADGTVRLWRVSDWYAVATLRGHTAEVRSCAFSPDGLLLASASNDETVRVWRICAGRTVAVLAHRGGPVWDCAFAPDGKLLAAATSGLIRLWRTADWRQANALRGCGDEIDSCAFSPDGAHVAGTSYGTVQRWHLDQGPTPTLFSGHTGAVWACAFSPDGAILATASNDQTVRMWRTSDGETLRVLAGGPSKVNSCAFSPDGRLVATTDYSGEVLLRDASTGSRRRVLRGHDSRVISSAFSPDGRLLATTSKGDVRLWNVEDGSVRAILEGHTDWVRSCMFSPDGALLATASADRSVRLWSVSDARPHALFEDAGSGFRSCALSPNGEWLVAGTAAGAVRLWRLPDGRAETILGHNGGVHSCAFSPDGSLLATVSGDRTVRLWRVADHTSRASLSGHTSWADRCAFSPDGSLLATVSNDQTIRLWEVTTGACVCALRVGGPLAWVAWHPDGTRLCAVGGAGTYLLRYLS